MKKIIFIVMYLSLCGFSSFSHAEIDYCPYSLSIIIKNQTQDTCHLEQQNIQEYNTIQTKNNIPATIEAGQESQPYIVYTLRRDGPNISLTYNCGENKFVTISSVHLTLVSFRDSGNTDFWGRKIWDWNYKHQIIGSILSLANMSVKHDIKEANCIIGNPATLIWTFL